MDKCRRFVYIFGEWRSQNQLCFWVALANTYLIATLFYYLSIVVHDGGMELDSLLFDGNSGGNLWSVPSAA